MVSTKVEKYISKRYERWLDYASYHCEQAGMPEEACDVLNEVLCSLLQKDNCKLEQLLSIKKNGYTELDFFVLKMIKLNATSDTSPYRSKYKPMPVDDNVDYSRLDIEDISDDSEDRNAEILNRLHLVRDTFENLELGDLAAQVFEFHFFQDGNFSEWEGSETLKQLYEIYNGVQELIRKKIDGSSLF
jgi:hypothetical protein bacD2_24195|nr:MAG TPA: hypothetical protein [Caudoviricetes sp.]